MKLLRVNRPVLINDDGRLHFRPRRSFQFRNDYFGYLNSGAAFSASLEVFIDASHLLFLLS